jgi:DNA (cytosine-5)-methyltransferase 1
VSRPRLLDLFCGAGGSAVGYHRAGFDVVGVDIAPQPNYPFEFHQADALTFPLDGYDAIHASPVCSLFTVGRNMWKGRLPDDRHVDLLTPTRARLVDQPALWIIENVPGAPMRRDLQLCGSQFGLGVRRHRWFEFSVALFALIHPCSHHYEIVSVFGGGALSATPRGGSRPGGIHRTMQSRRHVAHVVASQAMGIDWMTRDELSQAIPPAYTEFIGGQLLAHLDPALSLTAPGAIRPRLGVVNRGARSHDFAVTRTGTPTP